MKAGSRLMVSAAMTAVMTCASVGGAAAEQVLTLEEITVLATKARQRAIDALAGVSNVGSSDIERIQPAKLQDLFRGMPGVTTVENADDPGIGFNIRGLQDFGRVAVIVDGARQNFEIAQHGPQGKTYLDPELIGQAEVARGPVSNIYGSGAIGGVVSLSTKGVDDVLFDDERFGTLANGLGISNGGSLAGSLFVAARPTNDFDIIAGITHRTLGDYTDGNGDTVVNSGSETTSGLVKGRLRPAEGHQIELGALFQHFTFNSGNPNASRAAMEYANTVTNNTLTGKYTFASPDNPLIDLSVSAFLNNATNRSVVLKQYCAFWMGPTCGMDFTGPVGTTSGYDLTTIGFDAHNAARFDAFGAQNTLTIGADAFRDDVGSVGSHGAADAAYRMTASGNRLAYGAFAQWQAEYGSYLDVIGALRFDGYRSESSIYTGEGKRLSPKLTVAVTPLDGFTLYGTYAEGYRAPGINESFVESQHPGAIFRFIPNPSLRPEIGRTLEAGINAQYDNVLADGDQFGAKLNVFQNNVTDYIGLEDLDGQPTCGVGVPAGCYGYVNLANVVIRGVEMEADYDAGAWFAKGNLAFLEGKDTDTGDHLETILPVAAGVTVGARFLDNKLTVAPNWRYASASKDGSFDAYHLFGLTVAYQATENTVASLVVDNVFNQQYTQFLSNNAAPGFSVKGALKVRLGAQ